jgi:hypothetical protein
MIGRRKLSDVLMAALFICMGLGFLYGLGIENHMI